MALQDRLKFRAVEADIRTFQRLFEQLAMVARFGAGVIHAGEAGPLGLDDARIVQARYDVKNVIQEVFLFVGAEFSDFFFHR